MRDEVVFSVLQAPGEKAKKGTVGSVLIGLAAAVFLVSWCGAFFFEDTSLAGFAFPIATLLLAAAFIANVTGLASKTGKARMVYELGRVDVYVESSEEPGKWSLLGEGLSAARFAFGGLYMTFDDGYGNVSEHCLVVRGDPKVEVNAFLKRAGVMELPMAHQRNRG